jgi:5-methyltetrahydrofolate--homocysteine methyltransferase
MKTTLTNKDSTVVISSDHPFVAIGERINPTRRKKLAATMAAGDFSLVIEEAKTQAEAGAQILDINAGIPGGDEPVILSGAVRAVMDIIDTPLCFDSANPEALEAALKIYPGKALINSTTAEIWMMERIFPIAKEYDAAVIGVISDDNGIPKTAEQRLQTAENLLNKARKYGLQEEDIIIDPLALTVSADHSAGRITLDAIQLINEKLGANISLGASNVSFGIPDRKTINTAYLALAISRGLTTAITDPTHQDIKATILACDLLMGKDEFSAQWIKYYRAREKGET